MSKARRTVPKGDAADLRPEYRFDYAQAKPNRFALQMSSGVVAVVLEPDVAKVFHSSASVNALLRSVISAVSKPAREAPVRRARKKAG